jgi:hypothetical protein
MEQFQSEREFLRAAQATLEAETEEMVQVSHRLHDNLVKAVRLMWRQLLFIWSVVILLFIAYFFVLSKPAPVAVNAAPQIVQVKRVSNSPAPALALQGPPLQESRPSAVIPEWGTVTGLIEQIRTAQLKKDINLFLNAYSPTFSNIDKKKESMLKIWHQYNYLDMKFHVENIEKPDDHTIIARVSWDITLEDVRLKKKSSMLKDYTIFFSDTSGRWLIQDLVQGERTSDVAARPT